jgi:hypothetical protein
MVYNNKNITIPLLDMKQQPIAHHHAQQKRYTEKKSIAIIQLQHCPTHKAHVFHIASSQINPKSKTPSIQHHHQLILQRRHLCINKHCDTIPLPGLNTLLSKYCNNTQLAKHFTFVQNEIVCLTGDPDMDDANPIINQLDK